jgi:hypothetical protein
MSAKPLTVHFENGFDWELLCVQKQHLLDVIFTDMGGKAADEPHPLDGLIEIIDEIQDQAAELGEPVIFSNDDGFDYEDTGETIVDMFPDAEEESANDDEEEATGT